MLKNHDFHHQTAVNKRSNTSNRVFVETHECKIMVIILCRAMDQLERQLQEELVNPANVFNSFFMRH